MVLDFEAEEVEWVDLVEYILGLVEAKNREVLRLYLHQPSFEWMPVVRRWKPIRDNQTQVVTGSTCRSVKPHFSRLFWVHVLAWEEGTM